MKNLLTSPRPVNEYVSKSSLIEPAGQGMKGLPDNYLQPLLSFVQPGFYEPAIYGDEAGVNLTYRDKHPGLSVRCVQN